MTRSRSLAAMAAVALAFSAGAVLAQHGEDDFRVLAEESSVSTIDAVVAEANALLESSKLDEFRVKRAEAEQAHRDAMARLNEERAVIERKQKQLNDSFGRLKSPVVKIQAILAEVSDLDDQVIQAACSKVHAETVQAARGEERPGVYTMDSVNATRLLAAVEKQCQVQVLSRPSILAVDGQIAEITIGQLVSQVAATRMTAEGKAEVVAEEGNVGLMVSVVPTVDMNDDTKIELSVNKSALSGKTVPAVMKGSRKTVSAPVVESSRMQTVLQASDGRTVLVAIKGKPSEKWFEPTKTTLVLLTPRVVKAE